MEDVMRLTKENIVLKGKLDKAEDLIEELQLKLSQQAKHIYTHETKDRPRQLCELFGGSKSAGGAAAAAVENPTTKGGTGAVSGAVSAEEYDALESELEAARERIAELEKRVASDACSGIGPSPSRGDAHELHEAKRRIDELQASEKKLKEAVADLNNAIEHMSPQEDASDERPQVALLQEGDEESQLRIQCASLAQQLDFERLNNEALVAEISDLRENAASEDAEELNRLRKLNSELQDKCNEAIGEKKIALRVKEDALREAATVKTEVEKQKAIIHKLQQKLKTFGEGQPPTQPSPSPSKDMLKQVVELGNQVSVLTTELAEARKERDQALKAGKKAFLERQSALQDVEAWKHELKASKVLHGGDSSAKVDECLAGAAQKFEEFQERLRHQQASEAKAHRDPMSLQTPTKAISMGGDDWAAMMYEAFFEYERQIWNLRNEIMSLNTILQMNGADSDDHWQRRLRTLQEETDFLRSQLLEQRGSSSYANNNNANAMAQPLVGRVRAPLGYDVQPNHVMAVEHAPR